MVSLYIPVEFLNSIIYEPFSNCDKSMLRFPFNVVLYTIFPEISKTLTLSTSEEDFMLMTPFEGWTNKFIYPPGEVEPSIEQAARFFFTNLDFKKIDIIF